MRCAITPANQDGTRFTYPGRMEGWVDLGSLIMAQPRIKRTTAWLQVRCPNHYATKPPNAATELVLDSVLIFPRVNDVIAAQRWQVTASEAGQPAETEASNNFCLYYNTTSTVLMTMDIHLHRCCVSLSVLTLIHRRPEGHYIGPVKKPAGAVLQCSHLGMYLTRNNSGTVRWSNKTKNSSR